MVVEAWVWALVAVRYVVNSLHDKTAEDISIQLDKQLLLGDPYI